jgi:hypothetical protein
MGKINIFLDFIFFVGLSDSRGFREIKIHFMGIDARRW